MTGNSNPGFFTGQIPTAAQWNSYFSEKQDYPVSGPQPDITGVGQLNNLEVSGGTVCADLPYPSPVNCIAGSGTLAPGTYYYVVTSLSVSGESTGSPETSFVLSSTGGVVINWSPVPGAVGYRIYGNVQGAEWLIGSTTTAVTFTDNGTVVNFTQSPPTKNTTARILSTPENMARLNPQPTGIMIPFYYYANNVYTDPLVAFIAHVARKYPDVPFIAIINPNSGPGTITDGNYSGMIDILHGAGVRVIGYVDSANTTITVSALETTITTWSNLYTRMDGIFVDNMQASAPATDIPYYVAVTDFCHANGFDTVVLNPGTSVLQEYYACGDILVTGEHSSYQSYSTLYTGNFYEGSSSINVLPEQNALISYNVPFNAPDILLMAMMARWIFVTDAPTSNPYDVLPTYLDQLAGLLSQTNYKIGGMTITGLLVPAATLAATTGTLAAGTYYYQVTALSESGETLPSPVVSITVGASSGVTISWDYVQDAIGYKIYGRASGSPLLIASATQGTLSYTDTGAVIPSGSIPTQDGSGHLNAPGGIVTTAIVASGTITPSVTTVAGLPAAGSVGRMAVVTDATAPTYLGALTGGGTVKTPVFDNGTAWVSF